MILKNKTKYLLMAGMPGILTTPVYAQQIYMCKQCSAGTFANTKTSSCDTCEAGTYSGIAATSCTPCPAGQWQPYPGQSSCYTCSANTYSTGRATSCTPCTGWTYSNEGASGCISLKYEVDSTIAELTQGGQQTSGTLTPGFYVIILGAGDGGAPKYGTAYNWLGNGAIRAGHGAKLQYVIKIESNTSYTIGSGADGSAGGSATAATGGGGGSWANIGGTYYVAGGGGGAVYGFADSSNRVSSQGGYGGGIGGGGGGGDDWEGAKGTSGGDSGNYKGGAGGHGDKGGSNGEGLDTNGGGIGGGKDKYDNCGGDRFTKPNTNSYGGIGGLFSIGDKCFDDQIQGTAYFTTFAYNPQTGSYNKPVTNSHTAWIRNGGDGKTSHSSNTDKFTSRLCKNCAKIFKIK